MDCGRWTIDGGIATLIGAVLAFIIGYLMLKVYKQQRRIMQDQADVAARSESKADRKDVLTLYHRIEDFVGKHLKTTAPSDDIEDTRITLERDAKVILKRNSVYVANMRDVTAEIRRLKRQISSTSEPETIERLNRAIHDKEQTLRLLQETFYTAVIQPRVGN